MKRSAVSSITFAIGMALGLVAWQPAQALGQSYLFDVAGNFDGSDTIDISGASATWQHNNFGYPTGVTLNGTAWDPSLNSTLSLSGSVGPLNPQQYVTRVVRLSGRDAATARVNQSGAVQIDVDDTPNGPDLYHFKVAVIPAAPIATHVAATLTIAGTIDGSDVLTINNTQATWLHKFWANPSNVTVNGVAWNPNTNPVLPNSGATAFLPNGVSYDTVQLVKNSGRDLVGLDTGGNHLSLYFADNPIGADNYSATLTFLSTQYGAPAPGDANSDGHVDFNDLLQIQSHFGQPNTTWTQGDFDLDGTTSESDLELLAQNYTAGAPTPAQLGELTPAFAADVGQAFASVPEPGSFAVLGLAAMLLRNPRRRIGCDRRQP